MQIHDYISNVVALVAIVVSIISLVKTLRHNRIVQNYAAAGPEMNVLSAVSQARNRVNDISVKLLEIQKGRKMDTLNADEKRYISGMNTVFQESVENLLNAYEMACGMYRDGKIDRERFKRQYSEEIRNLFESDVETYQKRLLPITSPYRAMKRVYDDWHNLEK